MRAALLLLLLGSLGCGQVQQSVSSQDQAVEDLDNRDYTDAIALLEPLHAQQPDDSQISILLASAYSGSVGFDIVDSFDAFAPLMFTGLQRSSLGSSLLDTDPSTTASADTSTATSTSTSTDPSAADASTAPDAQALQDLETKTVKFLSELTNDFSTISDLPFPSVADRRRLVQALLVLGNIAPTDQNYVEAKTYAAVVGAFQFLNYTRDAMTDALGKNEVTFVDALCALQFDTFLQNLDTASDYLVNSIDDIQVAYKAHNKELPANLSGLGDSVQNVRKLYDDNQTAFSNAGSAFEATKASYCQ